MRWRPVRKAVWLSGWKTDRLLLAYEQQAAGAAPTPAVVYSMRPVVQRGGFSTVRRDGQ